MLKIFSRKFIFLLILSLVASFSFFDLAQSAGRNNLRRDIKVKEGESAAQTMGKRIALVIGNGNYTNISSLGNNPGNDAEDIANTLKKFGFTVIVLKNATRIQFKEAVEEFGRQVKGYDVALFFYAGHGVQVNGQNFLIPINASIDSKAALKDESVNLNYVLDILDEMDNKNAIKIVLIDACRNNPFPGKDFRGDIPRGLAIPTPPSGTVIAFAAEPGKTAANAAGQNSTRNGLFTAGLLTGFKGQDLSLDGVLTVASEEVEKESKRQQIPYVNGPKTLQKNFYFSVTVNLGAPIQDTVTTCTDCPEMVTIPGGTFQMGSNAAEQAQANKDGTKKEWTDWENPLHTVNVNSFLMGKYEVTRGEFAAFIKATNYDAGNSCYIYANDKWELVEGRNWLNPGYAQTNDDPVACVNWTDAKAYTNWLSKKTKQRYRLPSEAEWEYACRGGKQQTYCGSNDINSVAVYALKDGDKTQIVGSKQANDFGLYDMSGNVWEWVEDWFHPNYNGAPTDGSAWITGGEQTQRVLRGGSWGSIARVTRAASRDSYSPVVRYIISGFRVARTAP